MRKDPILWLLVLLGAGLRFLKIDGDLPYVFHYDEPTLIDNAVWLLQNGSLNPHFFHYPTGLIYLLALAFGVVLLLGQITGRFAGGAEAIAWLTQGTYPQPADGGVLYFYPTIGVPTLYLIGRSVSALAGTLAIPLLYALARRSSGSRFTARLAALILAISPLAVEHAHLVTTDTAAMAMATLTLLAVLKAEAGGVRRWIVAGALGGLTAGIKYNAGLVVLSLILLAIWQGWRGGDRPATRPRIGRSVRNLGLAAIAAIIVFLLTTPFALIDSQTFLRDLTYEVNRVGSVTAPYEGAENVAPLAIEKITEIFLHHLGILGILAACWGAIAALRSRRFGGIAILVWMVTGLIPLITWRTLYARYLLVFWPAILLLVAWGVHDISMRLRNPNRSRDRFQPVVTAALVFLVLFVPTRRLIAHESRRLQPDPRIAMTEWVETNIPAGERIVLERGGPFLSNDRYTLEYVDFLGRATLDAYRARGVRTLIGTGQEKRVRGEESFLEIFENLESIRAVSERPWSSDRLVVYRLTGGPTWEAPVREALERNDLRGAISVIEQAIEGGGATPFAWKTLAEIRFGVADTVGAIVAYREAALLDPSDVEIALALSNLYLAQADWDASIAELEIAKRLAPDDPLIFNNLAVAHLYRARDLVHEDDRQKARADWETAGVYASRSALMAPGDRDLVKIVEQVERMGRRWGFR